MQLFLAADIGGTHARVGLLRARAGSVGEAEVLAYRKFSCADYPRLAPLLQTFMDAEANVPVRHCVLACAGQQIGDEVLNDNAAWPIHLPSLRQALAMDDIAVINDFEALGYALGGSFAAAGRLLCGSAEHVAGPALVIGPGTGLGAAVRLPSGEVLTTEAGQMGYAPHTVRERAVLAQLAPHGGYVAYERIVSGPGLLVVYTALCVLDGKAALLATPAAVTAAAAVGSDTQAVEAVAMFCASLGSFAGSLAMTFMASGGVHLAGGFLHDMFAQLRHSAFEERFLHEGSLRAFLTSVPVWVTEHGQQGVLGAARWYLQHGKPGWSTVGRAVSGGAVT